MTRIVLIISFLGLSVLLAAAHGQSVDDIKNALTPSPVFRGPPDLSLDPTPKGLEPTNVPLPSIDLHIPFDFNSDQLTPDAILTLRRLGDALNDPRFANTRFRIAGHTDAKGTAPYNQNLSERRARVVRDYLVFQYAMDAGRLEAVGFGFTQLADPSKPQDGVNRRVQVINIGTRQ